MMITARIAGESGNPQMTKTTYATTSLAVPNTTRNAAGGSTR